MASKYPENQFVGLFDDLFGRHGDDGLFSRDSIFGRYSSLSSLSYKIEERPQDFILTIDVPGVLEADLSILLHNRGLTVSGKRGEAKFSKRFELADSADTEHIGAKLEHGVLTIVVAKESTGKPRKIPISKL